MANNSSAAGSLAGQVAVVTGASRGIGKGIALALGEAGACVYVTGRTAAPGGAALPGSIAETAEEVTARGGRGIPVQVDHADDAQIRGLFERVADEQRGRLDVLVNNVYKIPDPPVWGGGFWEHPVQVWDDQVGIGLRAHYVASVFGAPLLVARGRGLIANISSRGAVDYLFSASYGVGKCGLDRMSSDMAIELRPHGVAALSLWPGTVKTEFIRKVAEERGDLDLSKAENPIFTGRAVVALACDANLLEKSGGVYKVADLAAEYGFRDD
ncbi:MAG: SDR family NAD(P)-dependent oxidoreductase [Deltaproteobacteria bacterium]|nr:SDR family NAD(P)-dependent oxidoreductase [Deltaproteobacteria bacterium]MDD9854132.1 SDR family NAD(P)-dependent oxidoreductase [Deltaproteobacteria bacterium]